MLVRVDRSSTSCGSITVVMVICSEGLVIIDSDYMVLFLLPSYRIKWWKANKESQIQ